VAVGVDDPTILDKKKKIKKENRQKVSEGIIFCFVFGKKYLPFK